MGADPTTIRVSRETREQLGELKPYDSMSFDELLSVMAERTDSLDASV